MKEALRPPVAGSHDGAIRRGCTQGLGEGCATKRAGYLPVGITFLLASFFVNWKVRKSVVVPRSSCCTTT